MPRRDMTGPMGAGPMTGRGAGYCASAGNSANPPAYGCGRGRGYGRMAGGFGRGRYGYPQANAGAFGERSALNQQATMLENQLSQVKERLNMLNGQSK